jgi:2,5-diamino-6-(ribosylamino)-4(3H)-pyrimidinone 5'-phosphate reductase
MRPYVVCHMMPSLDGRLRTTRWDIPEAAENEYDRTALTYRPDAWLIGRVTMEEFADGRWRGRGARRGPRTPREDFVAPKKGEMYGIGLDSRGLLDFKSGTTEGDAVISVLSEAVSDRYLAHLRERGVSYIFAARKPGELDLPLVLRKLREKFGIRRLLVEGGGKTTGSFLRAGLVDEISLLLTPAADGKMDEPALFDTEGFKGTRALTSVRILSVRKARGGTWWLKARPLNRR